MSNKNMPRTPAALLAALRGDVGDFNAANTPGGIEKQEARGQQQFVKSETMPRHYNGDWSDGSASEILTKLGFTLLGEADDLFFMVKLPEGWTKQATSHSMHSEVLDAQGRKRIGVFYKAAYYDRSAHFYLERRFHANYAPITGYGKGYNGEADFVGIVTDRGVEIWRSEATVAHDDYKGREVLLKQARAWLAERYPDHESPFAYWDVE